MSKSDVFIVVIYLWAGFWTACIGAADSSAPKNLLVKALGCVLIAVIWPIMLPMHLSDMSQQ